MKFLTSLVLFVMFLSALVSNAATQYFAGSGTGTTVASYIAPASALPRVQYLNVTSDKGASVVTFYTVGSPVPITAVSSSSTTVTTDGSQFSGSDVLVLRKAPGQSTESYSRVVVSSVTTTNIVLSAAVTAAIGDQLYKATAAGTIPVGVATKELNAAPGAIWNGQTGKPLLIALDGGTNVTINAVSGEYVRQ